MYVYVLFDKLMYQTWIAQINIVQLLLDKNLEL